MSAVIKFIHTRPSLSDLFVCEKDGIPLHTVPDVTNNYTGFVSFQCDELIPPNELKARKSEIESVRPDLLEVLWPTEDECLLDMLIDADHPFYIGGNLSWNPLSLTWTQTYEFDTLDHLKTSYLYEMSTGINSADLADVKALRTSYNNNFEQKVFDNGVDITSTCDWLLDL